MPTREQIGNPPRQRRHFVPLRHRCNNFNESVLQCYNVSTLRHLGIDSGRDLIFIKGLTDSTTCPVLFRSRWYWCYSFTTPVCPNNVKEVPRSPTSRLQSLDDYKIVVGWETRGGDRSSSYNHTCYLGVDSNFFSVDPLLHQNEFDRHSY